MGNDLQEMEELVGRTVFVKSDRRCTRSSSISTSRTEASASFSKRAAGRNPGRFALGRGTWVLGPSKT